MELNVETFINYLFKENVDKINVQNNPITCKLKMQIEANM